MRTKITLTLIALVFFSSFQNCAINHSFFESNSENLSANIDTENPQKTVSLSSFGAVGDGITDDSAALRKAFADTTTDCLDGENRTYIVHGTLRADHGLCLLNVKLNQVLSAVDTRPYIHSAQTNAPPQLSFSETRYYPEDPILTESQHIRLEEANNLRTILVTGDGQSQVRIENVQINKGQDETLGNGGNAAAIYIDRAAVVKLKSVEIFGQGRGYGIFITRSSNIRISRLNIHDITWTLTRGDRAITLENLEKIWQWNNLPIYLYDPTSRKFSVVRSQEQASGLVISFSNDIEIIDSLISKILFRTDGTLIPWQADGITLAACKDVQILRTKVEHTWEGIDISGGDSAELGVQNFLLSQFEALNSFAFGIKIVHGAHHGIIEHSSSRFAALAGVTVSAPASDLIFEDLKVSETGVLNLTSGKVVRPWSNTTAGLMISYNPSYNPRPAEHIRIINSSFENILYPRAVSFGVKIEPGTVHAVLENIEVSGFAVEGTSGETRDIAYSYAATKAHYADILGCEGPRDLLIFLWDQSHSSVRSPAWTLPDLDSYLLNLRKTAEPACITST